MRLPYAIAKKLQLMLQGERLAASTLQHAVVRQMIEDGVIQHVQQGKKRAILYINNPASFTTYLNNNFGVADLASYVEKYVDEELTRTEAIEIAGDSKLKRIRTFKGFLVNSYNPIEATLNANSFIIHPVVGSYTFIADFESFTIADDVIVVGIENPANLGSIDKQQHLFKKIKPLFVSRYPQSNDLIKWLQSIPNSYLHFGDFDFAGIKIFIHEYKNKLGDKASFFIPGNIEQLIQQHGNRQLYDRQLPYFNAVLNDPNLVDLVALLHKYKKGLEQEVLIRLRIDMA